MSLKTSAPSTGKSQRRKSDNLVFVVSIFIAAVFWLLIKLSDTYNETYHFKVNYFNAPKGKNISRLIDSTLDISFKAKGFTILRLNLFENMEKININLKTIDMMSKDGDVYAINTDELKGKIGSAIGISKQYVTISKPTIGFVMEKLSKKEINVRANLSLDFEDQYDLYEKAKVIPSRVKVFGPRSILDTLTEVKTQRIVLKKLNADREVKVGITHPYSGLLQFDPEIVTIKLRVEKFTESAIETPVDVSGIKLKIKTFPAIVKVNFKVAQKDFNNISPSQFRVIPEVGGINLLKVDKLHLVLIKKPDFIRNEWITPTDVEFLIIK